MSKSDRNEGHSFELSTRLPVRIEKEQELEKKCPQFVKLLEKVADRLDSSGRSQVTQRKLDSSKQKTEVTRRKFLQANVRVETLNEVILKSELNSLTLPGASYETALVNRLKENLTMAEVSCMLDLGEIGGEAVTTLGIDQQDTRLTYRARLAEDHREFCRQLSPLVEDHLFTKCESILQLVDDDDVGGESRRALHPRILRLSDKVMDLTNKVIRDEEEVAEVNRKWEMASRDQVELMGHLLNKLDLLVNTHYAEIKNRSNTTLVKYLSAKTDALLLKLKCLELEVLNATYTKDSVAAIRKVAKRQEERIAITKLQIERLKDSLVQYKAAGPEFNQVVLEYARLQKEIEGKRWALNELGGGSNGPPAV